MESEYYKDDGSDEWKFNARIKFQICEEEIVKVFELTKQLVPETDNCVYMGGVVELCNSIIFVTIILTYGYYQILVTRFIIKFKILIWRTY